MPVPFSLASSAFADGSAIPPRFTCSGADVSPALAWNGAPAGTVSLALIVDDPDAPAGTFVHWVAYDIAGAPDGRLAEGVPANASTPRQGRNGFGRIGYGGPCPPPGKVHHYRFTLYALDRTLKLTGAPDAGQLRTAMAGHVLGEVRLIGTYRR